MAIITIITIKVFKNISQDQTVLLLKAVAKSLAKSLTELLV